MRRKGSGIRSHLCPSQPPALRRGAFSGRAAARGGGNPATAAHAERSQTAAQCSEHPGAGGREAQEQRDQSPQPRRHRHRQSPSSPRRDAGLGRRSGAAREGGPHCGSKERRPLGGPRVQRLRGGNSKKTASWAPRPERPRVRNHPRTVFPRNIAGGRGGSGGASGPALRRHEEQQPGSGRTTGGQSAAPRSQGPPPRRWRWPASEAEPDRRGGAESRQHPISDALPCAGGRTTGHVPWPGRGERPRRLQNSDGRRQEPAGRPLQLELLHGLQRILVHQVELLVALRGGGRRQAPSKTGGTIAGGATLITAAQAPLRDGRPAAAQAAHAEAAHRHNKEGRSRRATAERARSLDDGQPQASR
jgi:hypothetical protein